MALMGGGGRPHLASAWLRPRIAPDAVMMTGAAGALAGRVFRLPGGTMTPVRNGRWRVVERGVFKQAGGIVVGARPRGGGESKGDKGSAGQHRSFLRAFPRSISAWRACRRGALDHMLAMPPAAIDDIALALIDLGRPVGGLVLTVLWARWAQSELPLLKATAKSAAF
jgi:hypothetical protein